MTTTEHGPRPVRLRLHIRLDDAYLQPALATFADGSIQALVERDGELQVDLALPGPPSTALEAAELRLDRLKDNWRCEWRQSMRLTHA